MTLQTWLSDFIAMLVPTTALLGFVAYVLRHWTAERLTAGIRLETDKKLAQFQARLDAAEAKVSDVRRAGIEALQASNAAVLAQRVSATQEIWKAVVAWRQASALNFLLAAFMKEIAMANVVDIRGRETMGMWLKALESANLMSLSREIEKWRPFVSEQAWAVWIAYNAFFCARLSKATFIKMGNKEIVERLWLVNSERDLVRNAATAELLAGFDRDELTGTTNVIAYWESQLLAELKRGLAGEVSGPQTVHDVAKLAVTAEGVMAQAAAAKVAV